MGKKKPDPKRSGKNNKANDILEQHGMSRQEQHGANMRASAVPASDFEGEYKGPGTYNSPGAQRLQRVLWEVRMRGQTGIPKLGNDDMPTSGRDAMDLIIRGPKTTASPMPKRQSQKDSLTGRTNDAGTKSLLKGMLKFLK